MTYLLRHNKDFPCRLGQLLKENGCSRTQIRKFKQQAAVYLNGQQAGFSAVILPGDTIRLEVKTPDSILPQDLRVSVLFEDEYLLIVDKPAGMLSHPTTRQSAGTLANFLAAYSRTSSGFDGVHLVSRLDRAASGLVLVAKTALVQHLLSKIPLKKIYLARLNSTPPAQSGIIDLPIARKADSIIERRIFAAGKPSLTAYRTLAAYPDGGALVEFELITGRTHQIRVHSAALGCPLRDDGLYGADDGRGFFLRAHKLSFIHPLDGIPVIITAPSIEP